MAAEKIDVLLAKKTIASLASLGVTAAAGESVSIRSSPSWVPVYLIDSPTAPTVYDEQWWKSASAGRPEVVNDALYLYAPQDVRVAIEVTAAAAAGTSGAGVGGGTTVNILAGIGAPLKVPAGAATATIAFPVGTTKVSLTADGGKAFFDVGTSGITANATKHILLDGHCKDFAIDSATQTHIAAIRAGSTDATIYITVLK